MCCVMDFRLFYLTFSSNEIANSNINWLDKNWNGFSHLDGHIFKHKCHLKAYTDFCKQRTNKQQSKLLVKMNVCCFYTQLSYWKSFSTNVIVHLLYFNVFFSFPFVCLFSCQRLHNCPIKVNLSQSTKFILCAQCFFFFLLSLSQCCWFTFFSFLLCVCVYVHPFEISEYVVAARIDLKETVCKCVYVYIYVCILFPCMVVEILLRILFNTLLLLSREAHLNQLSKESHIQPHTSEWRNRNSNRIQPVAFANRIDI